MFFQIVLNVHEIFNCDTILDFFRYISVIDSYSQLYSNAGYENEMFQPDERKPGSDIGFWITGKHITH